MWFGGRLAPRDEQELHVPARQPHIHVPRPQLVGELERRLADRVEDPELQRRFEGAGDALEDLGVAARGEALEVGANSLDERSGFHVVHPSSG